MSDDIEACHFLTEPRVIQFEYIIKLIYSCKMINTFINNVKYSDLRVFCGGYFVTRVLVYGCSVGGVLVYGYFGSGYFVVG